METPKSDPQPVAKCYIQALGPGREMHVYCPKPLRLEGCLLQSITGVDN